MPAVPLAPTSAMLLSRQDRATCPDAAAQLTALVPKIRPDLLAYAARRVSQDDAEDVVQTALSNAFAGIDTYRPETAAMADWLHSILRHVIYHYCQQRDREPDSVSLDSMGQDDRRAVTDSQTAAGGPCGNADPCDLADFELRVRHTALSAEDLCVVLMKRDGFSEREVGKHMGLSRDQVHRRLVAACARLAACPVECVGGLQLDWFLWLSHNKISVYHPPPKQGSLLSKEALKRLEEGDRRVESRMRRRPA